MSEIVFEKHLVTRRVPGYLSRTTGEWHEPQEWQEVDTGFPIIAWCGSLSAAGQTEESVRSMIETMQRVRAERNV